MTCNVAYDSLASYAFGARVEFVETIRSYKSKIGSDSICRRSH